MSDEKELVVDYSLVKGIQSFLTQQVEALDKLLALVEHDMDGPDVEGRTDMKDARRLFDYCLDQKEICLIGLGMVKTRIPPLQAAHDEEMKKNAEAVKAKTTKSKAKPGDKSEPKPEAQPEETTPSPIPEAQDKPATPVVPPVETKPAELQGAKPEEPEVAKEDRYMYHPESDSYWVLKKGEPLSGGDGLSHELSKSEWEKGRMGKEAYQEKPAQVEQTSLEWETFAVPPGTPPAAVPEKVKERVREVFSTEDE